MDNNNLENQNPKKKKPLFLIIAIIVIVIILGIIAYLKFMPKTNVSDYSTFAEPDMVKVTEKWGAVPVNQVVILFKEDVSKSKAKKIISTLGGKITGQVSSINLYLMEITSDSEEGLNTTIEKAASIDGVETVSPNTMVFGSIQGTPGGPLSDPLYKEGKSGQMYGTIGMDNAWKMINAAGMNINNVKVGVADEALYTKSSETGGKSKFIGDTTAQPDKDNNGNITNGGNNHGTLVTHVIGANSANGGVSGIASILGDKMSVNVSNIYTGKEYTTNTAPDPNDPTKVTFSDGTFYHNTIVKLQNLVDSGATVINCSYGPDTPDAQNKLSAKIYTKFFEKMAKEHPEVVFVAAAGNEGSADKSEGALDGKNYFPGGLALPNIVTVAAIDGDGNRTDFSNFSTGNGEVTIAAPGKDIPMATNDEGKTITANGTSFATPMVTGTIALMKSIDPTLTCDQIKALLKKTAEGSVKNGAQEVQIPSDIGGGVLKVDNAVFEVINIVRIKKGLPPYERDFLLKMSTIEFSAKGGPNDFTLEANIPVVGENGTDVVLEVTGQHALTKGNSTQHVSAAGVISWGINAVDKSVFVKVTRKDTGAYSFLTLNTEIPLLSELAGNWEGTFTIVDFDLPQTITVPDDIFAGTSKEEGCAEKVEALRNVPQKMILDINVLSENTCEITMKLPETENGDKGGEPVPFNYNQEEGKLTTSKGGDQGLTFEMYASKDDKNYLITDGIYLIDMTQEGKRFMIKANLDAKKPK